jgi:hypothetical protein
MGSADSSLAVNSLYGDGHRKLYPRGAGRARFVGDLLAAAPARPAFAHWSVLVCTAVCRQAAQFQEDNDVKKSEAKEGPAASELISQRIAELGDWRGKTLARMRKLIKEADPDVVEEWKWMGTPVWEHDGIICTGESYKNHVKLTFAKGASLKDPARLFNSSLDGNVRRAIDIHEGEEVGGSAFKALVRQSVALNSSRKSKSSKKAKG